MTTSSSFMDDRAIKPLTPESWAGSQMLLREPSGHRIDQRIRVVGEQAAFPARRTMVGHQHILDARDERSLGACGAEQRVWLERQHNDIGFVAQDQDWTRNTGDPVGAVGRTRPDLKGLD